MKRNDLKILIVLVSMLASCTPSGGVFPVYNKSEDTPEPDIAAPEVDEEIAKQVGAMKIIYHVGPVDLPSGTKSEAMLDRPLTMRFQMDKEIWVTGFKPRVVDSNGKELPPELLHRAIAFNMKEENPICAGSPNPFAIATSLLTEIEFPQGFGYPVLPSDPIEVNAVLKNPTSKDYAGVFFEITFTAKPMMEFTNVVDLKPMLLEIDPCSHTLVDVKPRAFVKISAEYPIQNKEKLVTAHALLGDFGASVELTSNNENNPFWRAEGELDKDHRITALSGNPFEDKKGISLKAGSQIKIDIAYDNVSDSWLSDVGAAMVYLAPAE